jgi:hypothetical protein
LSIGGTNFCDAAFQGEVRGEDSLAVGASLLAINRDD